MFDILIVKLNLEKQKKPIAKENVAEIVIYRRNIETDRARERSLCS